MNSKFERIVPREARVEKVATGFGFTEGPVWDRRNGCLIFSDIPEDRIVRYTPDGGLSDFRVPSGKSNGLTMDRSGRLVACEHANRRVSRTEPDGGVVAVATHFKGKRLNSPNDVIVKSDGAVYFTDPPYGLNPMFGVAAAPELPFFGVYRISPEGNDLRLLIDDMVPNGLAFSPDETRLYVADTERGHLRVFDVDETGGAVNGRTFIEMPGEPLAPDGLKVDRQGNVYVTGKGGIWVVGPGGDRLGVIPVPELPANLCWAEEGLKTLYITARRSVYRIGLAAEGMPVY